MVTSYVANMEEPVMSQVLTRGGPNCSISPGGGGGGEVMQFHIVNFQAVFYWNKKNSSFTDISLYVSRYQHN